jgi:thiamine pyrophosphokinase
MSSHHFVKEGQEPALIIANGASCSTELLQEIIEWQPFIIVLDGAVHRVAELGIRFDVLLGDFDSFNPAKLSLPFEFETIETPDQEKNDLEKGLDYLLHEKQIDAAHILWATGRRADHTLGNLNVMARKSQQMNLVMMDDYSKIYSVSSPFRKYYAEKQNLSLIPITNVQDIVTTNLQYNLNKEMLAPAGRYGSSNRVNEPGWVEITFSEGVLFLMECKD